MTLAPGSTLQVRWALGNAQQDGAANFGLPMRVEPFRNSKDEDWGCAAAAPRALAVEIPARVSSNVMTHSTSCTAND